MNEILKKEINKTTNLISSLIHEYLYKKEYTKTLDTFQQELAEKIKTGKFYSIPLTQSFNSSSLISYFKSGDQERFNHYWNLLIPKNLILTEQTLYKLNFNIQIYFAIYPILNQKANLKDEKIQKNYKKNIDQFKLFLEKNKPENELTSEFLSYFALPYIQDPRNNSTYIHLFKPEWSQCLLEQIEKCIDYYSPNNISNLPILYDIARGKKVITINNNINNTLTKSNNKNEEKKLKELQKENNELKEKVENNKKIFLDSQKNWCSLALDIISCSFELLELCHKFTNNQKNESIEEINDKLIKYQNFLVGNLNDLDKKKLSTMLQLNQINMKNEPKQKSSYNNVSISINSYNNVNTNSSLSNTIKKKSNTNISKEIKKNKIDKNEMKNSIINMKKLSLILNSKHPIYNEKISHLFKEIREKIYSKDKNIRMITLYQIFFYDILGTLSTNSYFQRLLSNKNVNLEVMKLVNSLANYNIGKNYLLSKITIIDDIFKCMISENFDTPLRQNCIGALQKFSLRKEAQNKLIELNIIHYLIDIFIFQGDILSDYSIEYGLALLMNLSLRKEGKEKFEAVSEKILNIFIKFLKYENIQVLTCINGMLYSLLSKKKIKKLAIELKIWDYLEELKKLKNELINRQIKYIQDELEKNSEDDDDKNNKENMNDKDDHFTEEDVHKKENFDKIFNEYPEPKVYDDLYMEKHYKILEEYLIKPKSELEKEEKSKIYNFMNENLNMTKVLLMTNSYRSNDSEDNIKETNNRIIKTEENYDDNNEKEEEPNNKNNNNDIVINDYAYNIKFEKNNDFDDIYGRPDDGFAFKTNDKIQRTPPRNIYQNIV